MDIATLLLFCIVLVACIVLHIEIFYALLIGLILFIGYALLRRFSVKEVLGMCIEGIFTARNVLLIFFLIGLMTAFWRASGTIAFIVSCAGSLIHPAFFLLLTFVLNSVVSTLTGTAFGTSASKGVVRLTIRGENEWEMDKLEKRIDGLAWGLCAEYGLTCRTEFCDVFPETRNHKESVEYLRAVCGELGIPVHIMPHPERSSEDFGHFTKVTKGVYFFLGNGNEISHHTVNFDFPDGLLRPAVDIFCAFAHLGGRIV